MNINDIEAKREAIQKQFQTNSSPILNLFYLTDYLHLLISQNDKYILEAFFKEFHKKYLLLLEQFTPSGLTPDRTKHILSIAELYLQNFNDGSTKNFKAIIESINQNFNNIKNVLEGEQNGEKSIGSIKFPIIENCEALENWYGFVEEISITITEQVSECDKFIVVPNLGEIEGRLQNQINHSWQIANNYLTNHYNRINKFHKVVIQFEKKYGLYVGESLGIALTIGFIQALIKYYNLRRSVLVKSNIALTGGVDKNDKVKSVSTEVIEKKIQTVFYSEVKKFIVPNEDIADAKTKLAELNSIYPKRELQLIGIERIDDLLNRRDIIEIKKQNLVFWGFKKIIKNKFALLLLSLLIILSSYFLFRKMDNNPTEVEFENNDRSLYLTAYVKNKYGNIIWIKSPEASGVLYRKYPSLSKKLYNIKDINKDGKNEVFLTRVDSSGALYNYSNNGYKIWSYVHHENIETKYQKFSDRYSINSIIDIIDNDEIFEIVAIANHNDYYPNIILKVNAKTGEPFGEKFYHAGNITGAEIFDLNNDDQLDLIASGISYGYDKAFLFSIKYGALSGSGPTLDEYSFKDNFIANFTNYLLLPRTDLGQRIYPRLNPIYEAPKIFENEEVISVTTLEDYLNIDNLMLVEYRFSFDFKNVEIVFNELFITKRDELVKNGKLKKPLTDTHEYRTRILKEIKSWNGKSFIELNPKLKN